MKTAEFDYPLPEDLIAQRPSAERGASRLLHLNCASGAIEDLRFTDFPRLVSPSDLVVLNEHASSYLQDLQTTLVQMVESGPEQSWVDRPGGVFLRRSDLMPPEDATLLAAAARVVMDETAGNLREQLKRPQIPFGPEPGQIPEVAASAPPVRDGVRSAVPDNL